MVGPVEGDDEVVGDAPPAMDIGGEDAAGLIGGILDGLLELGVVVVVVVLLEDEAAEAATAAAAAAAAAARADD